MWNPKISNKTKNNFSEIHISIVKILTNKIILTSNLKSPFSCWPRSWWRLLCILSCKRLLPATSSGYVAHLGSWCILNINFVCLNQISLLAVSVWLDESWRVNGIITKKIITTFYNLEILLIDYQLVIFKSLPALRKTLSMGEPRNNASNTHMTTSALRGLMRIDIGYSEAACSRLIACPLTSRMQCLP